MRKWVLPIWLLAASLTAGAQNLLAAEHGTGIYLLGSKGPAAAVVPAPGLYLQSDLSHYRASAHASAHLPMGDKVAAGVKARALIGVPTLIWSTPYTVGGGRVAIGVSQPLGRESVSADVVLGSQSAGRTSRTTTRGDPIVSAIWGWQSGAFHWNTTAMVNVPLGDYRKNSMANLSYNHWALDLSLSGTWLDPASGWDISGVAGITFNDKNPATNYRSGNELHFEGSISRYITPRLSLGAIGYHYQQVTDDKGSGAVLGGFRGRVSALGATAAYTFTVDERPIMLRVKGLREFNVKNRLKGTATFLTLTVPLM